MPEIILNLVPGLSDMMKQHVKGCFPEEACGLVGGVGMFGQKVIRIKNELASQKRFRMKPLELIRGLISLEKQGLQLLAIYHSHPTGPTFPSTTDTLEYSYPGIYYLIWSCQDREWVMRAYYMERKPPTEIKIAWTNSHP